MAYSERFHQQVEKRSAHRAGDRSARSLHRFRPNILKQVRALSDKLNARRRHSRRRDQKGTRRYQKSNTATRR